MILFVCSGNTCRSPLAAALARADGVEALSAGVEAEPGDPATPEARRAAERHGADLSGHRSRNVQEQLISEASWVYAVTRYEEKLLKTRFPDYAGRIRVLDPSVSDPDGGDDGVYEACVEKLLTAMRNAGILKPPAAPAPDAPGHAEDQDRRHGINADGGRQRAPRNSF